jgi:hypothetical protein
MYKYGTLNEGELWKKMNKGEMNQTRYNICIHGNVTMKPPG